MPDAPHEIAASEYMTHKGYAGIEPLDIQKLEDISCWYFLYRLPEGVLELEVSWNADHQEWDTLVTAFG